MFGKMNIIAEDLGFIAESVVKLLRKTDYPGMKVLQFAFDSREGSNDMPYKYDRYCAVYTGTHDNTVLGWYSECGIEDWSDNGTAGGCNDSLLFCERCRYSHYTHTGLSEIRDKRTHEYAVYSGRELELEDGVGRVFKKNQEVHENIKELSINNSSI